jgi:hypothetical protein
MIMKAAVAFEFPFINDPDRREAQGEPAMPLFDFNSSQKECAYGRTT